MSGKKNCLDCLQKIMIFYLKSMSFIYFCFSGNGIVKYPYLQFISFVHFEQRFFHMEVIYCRLNS